VPDYLSALSGDVRGMKIGVPKEYMGQGVDPQVKEAVYAALRQFEALGAVWEEVSLPHSEYALAAYYIISSSEASSNLARYDGVRYGLRSDNADNLLDMYAKSRSEGFGAEVKRRIMLGTFALSSGYYDAYYLKAQKVRTLIRRDFDRPDGADDGVLHRNPGQRSADHVHERHLHDSGQPRRAAGHQRAVRNGGRFAGRTANHRQAV